MFGDETRSPNPGSESVVDEVCEADLGFSEIWIEQ